MGVKRRGKARLPPYFIRSAALRIDLPSKETSLLVANDIGRRVRKKVLLARFPNTGIARVNGTKAHRPPELMLRRVFANGQIRGRDTHQATVSIVERYNRPGGSSRAPTPGSIGLSGVV